MNPHIKIMICVAATLLVACNSSHEDLTLTYFSQSSPASNKSDSIDKYADCIAYDSVCFSDGSYAIHQTKNHPQNSLTEFFDRNGRTIATASRASECYGQTMIYNYDNKGNLINLIRFKNEIFDGLENDSTNYERNEDGYLAFRKMIDGMDYEHPDTAKYEQTNIEYDNEGNAVKAYKACSDIGIKAPKGYKLTVCVRPCTRFWTSDLNGGYFVFHVMSEPQNRNMDNYATCRYADFLPTTESFYKNGHIVKTVIHPCPYISGEDKEIIFKPEWTEDGNVYNETKQNGNIRQDVYYNGLLTYWQEVSKYGTVLKRYIYMYLPDDRIEVIYKVFDYKTKKLKVESETVIDDVPNIEIYQEDLGIDRSRRWEDYYF